MKSIIQLRKKEIANKGITLIALVITIIILLILASISIAVLTGENGILNKASKAKEEHIIEQYKEEINLIIIDEIAERKIVNKEELMIVSLDTKIREKEWVNEIYKCNSNGEEQPTFEASTHLLVESKEHYEFLIEVDEAKQTAKIVSFQKGTGEKYTITYHPNKGEGQEETVEIRQGFSVTLKECNYEKEQYKFVGWCENQNGEGKRYLGNASYKPEGQVTLYAIWELNVATIIFDSNNGTSNTNQVTVTKGKETKLAKNTFTRKRYTFLEWNTKPDGTGTKYEEEAIINVEADITLYAIWKTNVNTKGKWDGEVNSPKLTGEMTTVYWKEDGTEVIGEVGENWYHYKAGNNSTDTRDSHWANAKNKDSYFVWIPRYEYKILSGEGTSTAGKIEVKFIPTTQTSADAGYKIHPAFQNGTNNNFKNGEWDKELDGIWVAKYEASRSDASISAEGTSTTMKIVPGVVSWRNIRIGKVYTKTYNYDRSKESHLIKNSEWGAVAYLTHSQYGRNGKEIDINNSSSYITGNGGGSPTASEKTGVTNAYNTKVGSKASTTGNIYGIYDISGGAFEFVAGYITNGNGNLSSYGSDFVAKTIADVEGYKTISTKYATAYPYNSTNDKGDNNYISYKNAKYGYGDAILETSSKSSQTESLAWLGDYVSFPYSQCPFFVRGAVYNYGSDAGIFVCSNHWGSAEDRVSFRPVLAF